MAAELKERDATIKKLELQNVALEERNKDALEASIATAKQFKFDTASFASQV